MKNILISMGIVATLLVAACQKNETMNSNFNVDTQRYETLLAGDYSNALQYHNLLNVADANPLYLNGMFNTSDSLFSEHFYEFCVDMMQNSGMMSTSNGMMGSNSNMMNGNGGMMGGNGGMMNGNTMGGMADMNQMMNYMDSLHHSALTRLNPDYMNTDSLMHNQMTLCNMMTGQTDSIDILYGDMHIVRMNHHKMHGN